MLSMRSSSARRIHTPADQPANRPMRGHRDRPRNRWRRSPAVSVLRRAAGTLSTSVESSGGSDRQPEFRPRSQARCLLSWWISVLVRTGHGYVSRTCRQDDSLSPRRHLVLCGDSRALTAPSNSSCPFCQLLAVTMDIGYLAVDPPRRAQNASYAEVNTPAARARTTTRRLPLESLRLAAVRRATSCRDAPAAMPSPR